MKNARLISMHALTAVATASLIFALGAGNTSTSVQPDHMDPASVQRAMEGYMQSIKPSANHKHFDQFVGDWQTTTKMFMAPGMPPIETSGTANFELILGGRFLQQQTTGTFKIPGVDGQMTEMPMDGMGLFGYDNNRKLYTMVFSSSMDTAIFSASGGISQDRKTMTMFGEMDEPLTGEVGKAVRHVTKMIDADHFVLQIAEVIYGEPFTVVEVSYWRTPKPAAAPALK